MTDLSVLKDFNERESGKAQAVRLYMHVCRGGDLIWQEHSVQK